MHPKLPFRRPVSASMVVSLLALSVALGGVGWAATALPAGSVGRAQLQNGAVGNHKIRNGTISNHKLANGSVGPLKLRDGAVGTSKIQNGAVGLSQIDSDALQARITQTCPPYSVLGSVDRSANIHCHATGPREFGTSSGAVALSTTGPTAITTVSLRAGANYLVFADPYVVINGALPGQQVSVDCSLAVIPGSGATDSGSMIVEVGSSLRPQIGTIALQLPARGTGTTPAAGVTCVMSSTPGASPNVTVAATINAIRTRTNA